MLRAALPRTPPCAQHQQPKNYLDFVGSYRKMLAARRKEVCDTRTRLSHGLAKLEQASEEVDVLQRELTQAKVVVEAATQECNQLLEVRARCARAGLACMRGCMRQQCSACQQLRRASNAWLLLPPCRVCR